MKMVIELELFADIDEEAMTVNDKLEFLENILHYGCQACQADFYVKLLEIRSDDYCDK